MQETYKKTILHNLQLKIGAKMIGFGAWLLPVHYGSQILEHHAVRQDAGLFDVSHMRVIDIKGLGSKKFLGYLLSNDVEKLTYNGQALYSCMCNSNGGIIDDLIVYKLHDEFYRLVVNAGRADDDLIWIKSLQESKSYDAEIISQKNLSILALQGPEAKRYLEEVLKVTIGGADCSQFTSLKPFFSKYFLNEELGDFLIARTGYTGEDGFEIIAKPEQVVELWKMLIDLGVKPCGLGARDSLRIEAGLNLYGQDMDESTNPFDVNLGWTVGLGNERDFVGKNEILCQGQSFQFCGIRAIKENGIFRAGQHVTSKYGDGLMTSGTFSPTLAQSIGLAKLPMNLPFGERVQVHIRNKLVDAEVVKLPFVRKGKVLI